MTSLLASPDLRELCDLCRSAVAVDGASVTVHSGASRATLSASGPRAAQIAELQSLLGRGPGIDARRCGRPVLVPDLRALAASTWPGLVVRVLRLGVHGLFSFPVQVGPVRLGALDLHRAEQGALTTVQVSRAVAVADAIAVRLVSAPQRTWHCPEVDEAAGMVTVQLGVCLPAAFARLRAHALSEGRALEDVAADVVARRLRFGGAPARASGLLR